MTGKVQLKLATVNDAGVIHKMKYDAFLPLYEKYHDDQTSPVKEPEERVIRKIERDDCDYYLIRKNGVNVGAVNVCERLPGVFYISPIFILPDFQNQGLGYAAIQKLFEQYPEAVTWRLDTILQETGNCHLYEKCGFVRTGKETPVNEKMTLVDYEKRWLLFDDSKMKEKLCGV